MARYNVAMMGKQTGNEGKGEGMKWIVNRCTKRTTGLYRYEITTDAEDPDAEIVATVPVSPQYSEDPACDRIASERANLVAAAPELLAALQAAIRHTVLCYERQDQYAGDRAPWLYDARAAIATAEGR